MSARRSDLAVAVCNGALYAAGGTGSGPQMQLTTVEKFDPTTNAWEEVGAMSTKRSGLGLAAL